MKQTSPKTQTAIQKLRLSGLTHRQIAKALHVSQGTAVKYSKHIHLTPNQKRKVNKKNYLASLGRLTKIQRHLASQKGGKNTLTHFKIKYSSDQLLSSIKKFYFVKGRIPTKRDYVSQYRPILRVFKTWNNAIRQAGFSPNPVLFAKKYIATDGHRCDSFSEKIIDDWLSTRKINHERNIHYGKTKFTADFKINDSYIEFFGLHGQLKRYDVLMKKKLQYVRNHKLKLISLYPNDLFPKNNLKMKLHDIM